jgi:DNA-binding response OmpR family regulator/HPt (histidine-containing phosphotransfer) domain-containing protein
MAERGVAEEMAQALATVREGFRSSASERMAQLRRHADSWKAGSAGASSQFAQLIHTLRTSASTLGFSEVSRLASELEKLAAGDTPAFPARLPSLLQSLQEAFAHPPSTLPLVPHRPRVLVRLADHTLAQELVHQLEVLGMDAVAAASEEEAVRLVTAERPVERVVVGPTVPSLMRSALRSLSSPPPLVLLVPTAELRTAPREGVDAVLSLGTPASALARELVSLQRASPARFRVLAVDDDSAVLAAARAVLEAAGMEVVTLSDARNLFSSLQRHHPDLLLLEVAMPGMDGFELISQLRADPAWRTLTVVFHTARDSAADRVRAFQLGVDDYLIKPVEPAELRLRLMTHMQRRTFQRSMAEKEAAHTASHAPALRAEPPSSSSLARAAAHAPALRAEPPSSSSLARAALSPASAVHRPTHPGVAGPQPAPASRVEKEQLPPPAPRSLPPPGSQPTQASVRFTPPSRSPDAPAAPARPGASATSRPTEGAHRILVADDEPALRRVLQRLLEQEGYVVETVEDGEQALTRLLNPSLAPVDLLLLDVHMPRRSGIEVLRALREASSPVRALVLSARIRDEDVMKLYNEGAVDFVAKPFSIHTLLARVIRLLPPRTP